MTNRADRRRLPAEVGLAHLLPNHFALGRRFAGLAGFSGTVATQIAGHVGALQVDDLRLFEALGVYGALWSLAVWLVPWERFGETWITFVSLASSLLIFASVRLTADGDSPIWAYHIFVIFLNALYLRRWLAFLLLPVSIAASALPALLDSDRAVVVQQLAIVAPVYAVLTLVGTVLVGQLVEAVYARLREGETRRLYEEATRWSGQLEAIQEVTRRLNRLTDLPAIYDAIVTQTGRVIAHDRCYIHLLDGDDLLLVAPSAELVAGTPLAAILHPRDLDELIGGIARGHGASPASLDESPDSVLLTPLTSEGRVLGVITLVRAGRAAFSDGDRRLMTIVAGQAANAVANARLHAVTRRQAEMDGLTGLLNHGALLARLTEALAAAARTDEPVSVMMLDLDNFKQVNDAHGHLLGDEVLRRVGDMLRAVANPGDAIGRYGGDEFAVVLPATPGDDAAAMACRVLEAAARVVVEPAPGVGVVPRVSVGVASRPWDGTTVEALLARADQRLYAAKRRNGLDPARIADAAISPPRPRPDPLATDTAIALEAAN